VFTPYGLTRGAPSNGGVDVEFGVVFRSPRVFGIAAGAAYQPRAPAGESVRWFFIEPRLQFDDRGATVAAVTLRLAEGDASGSQTVNPFLVAPGVTVGRSLGSRNSRHGFWIEGSYMLGVVTRIPRPGQRTHRFALGGIWFP
jgi:hypothetical protein